MPGPNEAQLAAFSAALELYEQGIVDAINQFTKVVALDLHARVVQRTPVDTGRARLGWDLSPFVVPAPGGGLARSGGRLLTGYELANAVPYIVSLELGHSRQAPVGMLRVSVAEIETEYEGVTIDANLGNLA